MLEKMIQNKVQTKEKQAKENKDKDLGNKDEEAKEKKQKCSPIRILKPLNTKRRLLYLKAHFVPRSKHFSSRL